MQVNKSTFGANITIDGLPDSAEEWDKISGEKNSCLNAAVQKYLDHSYLGIIRPRFIATIEAESGIAREVIKEKTNADGSTTPIYERDSLYVEKVRAAGVLSDARFDEIAQGLVDENPVDIAGVRSTGRIAKTYLEQAESFHGEVLAAGATFDKFVKHVSKTVPTFQFAEDSDGNPTIESLAYAIKAVEDAAKRSAMSKLMA